MSTENLTVQNKLPVKLLVNKSTHKVLFAEAGKEFVDFLFSLLALPVGTVIQLLRKQNMVGSLGSLYGSLETMDNIYLQPNLNKDRFLNPQLEPAATNELLLQNESYASNFRSYYACPCIKYFTDRKDMQCPNCRRQLVHEMKFVPGRSAQPNTSQSSTDTVGYVQGMVTYMVMDDLSVSPMSMISSIVLLNKFQVKDVTDLEERTVEVGMDEGLKLLRASLHSTTVLSDSLLEKKVILE